MALTWIGLACCVATTVSQAAFESTDRDLSATSVADHTELPAPQDVQPPYFTTDWSTQDDVILQADRADAWNHRHDRMLLLDRQVSVAVGRYGFRADRAVVHIGSSEGPDPLQRQVWVYLVNARPLKGRGPVQASAPQLTVTIRTLGEIRLKTDRLRHNEAPVVDPLVAEAWDSLPTAASATMTPGTTGPIVKAPPDHQIKEHWREGKMPGSARVAAKSGRDPESVDAPGPVSWEGDIAVSPTVTPTSMVSPRLPAGTVSFGADRIVYQPHEGGESTVSLIGHVVVTFQGLDVQRSVSLTADNAVIFLAPDTVSKLAQRRVDATALRGVYLEDHVTVTDGKYTIRAPRVYYDLKSNRAVVLDAVFHTWNTSRGVPIYVRAKMLRQVAEGSWSAQAARLTTSEFAVPHFAIGAGSVSFRRELSPEGQAVFPVQAKDATLRWNDVPFGYWPRFSGELGSADDLPLKRVRAGYSGDNGPVVETTWDLFSLLGRPQPEGVEFNGKVDYLGDHGPALGLSLDYQRPAMHGSASGYLVIQDDSEDQIGDRRDVEFDGDVRGYALWQHRQHHRQDWELSLELAVVSDVTFLEEFLREQAEQSKPYETSIYLKKQEADWAFTFLAQYDLVNFVPQTTVLQAPGYEVEKLPELGFYQMGTSLLDDRVTYYGQVRLSRMRLRFGRDTPFERGFDSLTSFLLFGQNDLSTFNAAARARGLPKDWRMRADTRHELEVPSKIGPIDFIPYAVGRATGYEEDFGDFRGEDDQGRLWGGIGIKAHTQFSRTFNNAMHAMLDVHRLRHVVEPSVDVFWSGSTVNPEDLPVFDQDIEALHEGMGFRFAIRNTLQTQRGGPARWRSVDWLTWDAHVVLRSDDADLDTDIARFFAFRPELSLGGDHMHSDLAWMITDALAAVGQITFNMEEDRAAQWRVGSSLQHTASLTSFVDYAEIDALSSRLLYYGFEYTLTRKYHLTLRHVLDFGRDESRDIEVRLERRLPRWRMLLLARIDELDDEQTFGVLVVPEGLGSSRRHDRYRPDLLN